MSIETVIDDARAAEASARTSANTIIAQAGTEAAQAISVVIANRVADVALVVAGALAVWLGHAL
jgi:hypothetical protein